MLGALHQLRTNSLSIEHRVPYEVTKLDRIIFEGPFEDLKSLDIRITFRLWLCQVAMSETVHFFVKY